MTDGGNLKVMGVFGAALFGLSAWLLAELLEGIQENARAIEGLTVEMAKVTEREKCREAGR